MSEPGPVFSIIVPIYNGGDTLGKCIESIVGQSYNNIEIILVNDGSTDNSLSICESFKKLDLRISIISQKNSGASSAKNTGIEAAAGEYLLFIDADDYAESNMIERIYDAVAAERQDLVIFGYIIHEISNGVLTNRDISFCDHNYTDGIDRHDFMHLYRMPMLNQNWNKAYRANIVKSVSLHFLKDLSLGEDLIFNLEYMKHCRKISVIRDTLYNFNRLNTESLTRKFREDFVDIQKLLFHRTVSFVQVYYDDHNSMKTALKKEFLRSIIDYIARVARSKNLRFKKRKELVNKIINDKEILEISADMDPGSIKKKVIIYLIRLKATSLLIMLLKERK